MFIESNLRILYAHCLLEDVPELWWYSFVSVSELAVRPKAFAMYIQFGNMFKLTFAVVDESEDLYAWWKTIYQAKRPTGRRTSGLELRYKHLQLSRAVLLR